MNSPGHRQNLLDPNSREIGLGYYLRASDDRGYVVQMFGHEVAYPPVVIENEAINTAGPQVNLYIYDREPDSRLGPVSEMMISNTATFANAAWEAYRSDKAWTLEPGTGWRTAYVKLRDATGNTVVVSDTIYLGTEVPFDDLGSAQMRTN